MRCLLTASLLMGLIVAQASAQRGIAMGHAGGFSAPHGFSAPRMSGGSGFRSAPAPSFAPRSFNSLPQYHWGMPARPISTPQRSVPDWRRGYRPPYRSPYPYRFRPPYRPYFFASSTYLVPGLLNSYWDYPDYYNANDESSSAAVQNNGYDQQAQPDSGSEEQQQQQGEYVPPPPPAVSSEPSAPLAQTAVTLVFKDGHSQQVRNYAMTGSTLYVLDDAASGRRPEIPLSSINATATEKANQESGVDFKLPAAVN